MLDNTIDEFKNEVENARSIMLDYLKSKKMSKLYDEIAVDKLSDSAIAKKIGVSLFCYIYCCATYEDLKSHDALVIKLREHQVCNQSLYELATGTQTISETSYYDAGGKLTRSKRTVIKHPPNFNAVIFRLQKDNIIDYDDNSNVHIYIPELEEE